MTTCRQRGRGGGRSRGCDRSTLHNGQEAPPPHWPAGTQSTTNKLTAPQAEPWSRQALQPHLLLLRVELVKAGLALLCLLLRLALLHQLLHDHGPHVSRHVGQLGSNGGVHLLQAGEAGARFVNCTLSPAFWCRGTVAAGTGQWGHGSCPRRAARAARARSSPRRSRPAPDGTAGGWRQQSRARHGPSQACGRDEGPRCHHRCRCTRSCCTRAGAPGSRAGR